MYCFTIGATLGSPEVSHMRHVPDLCDSGQMSAVSLGTIGTVVGGSCGVVCAPMNDLINVVLPTDCAPTTSTLKRLSVFFTISFLV